MESNRMCNQMLGAPLAVVTDVPAHAIGMRTVAPSLGTVLRQESAWLQSAVVFVDGMRPTVADLRDYAVAPKHAPRAFALSGTRTWSPPV